MDVTKSNFEAALKQIEALLPSCSFVSIDLEFTGLNDNSRYSLNRYDLPSQRYMKQREMIKNFAMIQYGMCL